ncbi:adenosylcobinamide-phosphate synthase CbiB [Cognatishimia sp. MH4019]|uniref:adenosylcobinamide-phosphate synthase CbiB n=1 Tax=Cognatishimia sp. MH4019 TaxID=2854030 RepID=UPI001CD4CF44
MSLALALCLDALFGEPKWLWNRFPHPAVLMGRAIGWIDENVNKGTMRKLRGAVAFSVIGCLALVLGAALQALSGHIIDVILAAILLAQRSLVDHVKDVANGARLSLQEGRRMVGRIVGRDTSQMDNPAIARAAIESAAENFGDGVVAPAFWFAIGGLPGLLLYKVTNTADSMIGYRTPRHAEFGWAAARFDDLLNWVPARLTAALIALSHFDFGGWHEIRKDAQLHRSPNAGWPEAAMARVLGVALSGPRSYEGQMQTFPFVNVSGRKDIGPDAVDASVAVLWRAWILLLGGAVLIAIL